MPLQPLSSMSNHTKFYPSSYRPSDRSCDSFCTNGVRPVAGLWALQVSIKRFVFTWQTHQSNPAINLMNSWGVTVAGWMWIKWEPNFFTTNLKWWSCQQKWSCTENVYHWLKEQVSFSTGITNSGPSYFLCKIKLKCLDFFVKSNLFIICLLLETSHFYYHCMC